MFLHRLTHHIRRQDWIAIGIEFCIVVIGIYAAFELDRWREAESSKRLNETFLQMLELELEDKLPGTREMIESYSTEEDLQNVAIAWLNGEESTDRFTPDMCYALFQSLTLNWSATRLETPEIISGNDQSLESRDLNLRRLLFRLSSYQDRVDAVYMRFLSQIVNISDRYPELIIRADQSSQNIRDHMVCNPEGMRTNQAFKNQVFGNIGRSSAMLNFRRQELERLEAVAEHVKEVNR
jgi:hypothetical protein